MSGTSDTEYSSEGGSVEAVGSYHYKYDVSITHGFVTLHGSFKRNPTQLLFRFIVVPRLLDFRYDFLHACSLIHRSWLISLLIALDMRLIAYLGRRRNAVQDFISNSWFSCSQRKTLCVSLLFWYYRPCSSH